MRGLLVTAMSILAASAASAETERFDAGALPANWICGVTGKGSPR